MTIKTARVLKGYISLSPAEKIEFVKELNSYNAAPDPQKHLLSEGVEKTAIHLGPLSGVCGCCGK
jgi:hypothetical protein